MFVTIKADVWVPSAQIFDMTFYLIFTTVSKAGRILSLYTQGQGQGSEE